MTGYRSNVYVLVIEVLVCLPALCTGCFHSLASQDDAFGQVPITCYTCKGLANDSLCADPLLKERDDDLQVDKTLCAYGVCLKWTYVYQGDLIVERTCSSSDDIEFRLNYFDVCISEKSSPVGILCMCGTNLCNGGRTIYPRTVGLYFLLTGLVFYSSTLIIQ